MIFGTSNCWVILSPPSKKKRSPIEIRGQFNFLYLKLFILIPVKSGKTINSFFFPMNTCKIVDRFREKYHISSLVDFFSLAFQYFCPKGQKTEIMPKKNPNFNFLPFWTKILKRKRKKIH